MSQSYLPLNENVDAAVRGFVAAIVANIEARDPDIEVDVEFDDANSVNDQERAAICNINTQHGIVIVFPDFIAQTAKASILNRGLVQGMQLEGFDDAEIDGTKTLSKLIDNTEENATLLGAFLSRDLGLQHQKDMSYE